MHASKFRDTPRIQAPVQEPRKGRRKDTLLGDTTGTHRVTNAKPLQCLLLQNPGR